MAEPRIRPKRSSTASAVPTGAQLSEGELAINLADGKIYSKNSSGTVVQLATSASTATTATNISGGGAGQLPYNTASGTTTFLAAGTSGQILKSNGTSAPSWMSTSSITSIGTLSGLTITETNATDNTLVINAASGQSGNLIHVKDSAAANLFVVDGTGGVTTGYLTSSGLTVNGLIYPSSDGTSGQVLSTNGSGTLSWTTTGGGSAAGSTGDIQYNDGSGGFTASSYFSYGSSAYDKLAIYSSATTDNVVGIFAASGQTGNLLTLRDYLGTTTYSYFDSTGNLYLNAQNDVRFADADSSNYAAIQAPATIATNYTLTLPTTAGTSNYVLKTNGSGTLSWTNAITNLIGGNSTTLLGSIPYQSNTDTTTLLAPNTTTTKKFLRQTGTGTNGAAPAWDTIAASDVPTLNQSTTGNAATATNLAGGSGGQIHYQSAANTTAFLANGTAGQLLQSNGSTNAPSWVASPGIPTGALFPYAGATAPTGYLLCDGSSVSSTNYLALHAVLSNTYGGSAYTGASGLSFNLPDLRGRLPMGAGTGTGKNASGTGAPSGNAQTARARGEWGGEETHQLTLEEMANHNHGGATAAGGSATHSHTQIVTPNGSAGLPDTNCGAMYYGWATPGGYYQRNVLGMQPEANAASKTNNSDISHTHVINSAGSDSRHNTIPPYIVTNYIIKT